MIRVLVCWEDDYCEKLDLCLRRARRERAAPGEDEPSLLRVSARGHGGFAPYVKRGWPIARSKGLPKSGGPVDYLLCVADADRAADCCGIGDPPEWPAPTGPWVEAASQLWTEQLRREAGDDEGRVFGRFLRWNKESLLIAGYDTSAALDLVGCRQRGAIGAFLSSQCRPDPRQIQDPADFVERYRRPGACFRDLVKHGGGPVLSKGDKRVDDALGAVADHALPALLGRVPDLVALAELLRELCGAPRV